MKYDYFKTIPKEYEGTNLTLFIDLKTSLEKGQLIHKGIALMEGDEWAGYEGFYFEVNHEGFSLKQPPYQLIARINLDQIDFDNIKLTNESAFQVHELMIQEIYQENLGDFIKKVNNTFDENLEPFKCIIDIYNIKILKK